MSYLRRRRSRRAELALAVALSLLVNAGVLLPGAYLERHPPKQPEQPLEVELSPSPGPPDSTEVTLPDVPPLPPELAKKPRVAGARPPEQRAPKKAETPPKPEPKKVVKAEVQKKEAQPKPPTPEKQHLKMVEASNPETDKPPENARFLSDKNRSVKEETRAVYTNLEKDHPKPEPSSDAKAPKAEKPGSDKPKIAETREQKGERVPRGQREMRKRQEKASPLLSMRGQAAQQGQKELPPLAEKAPGGTLAPGQSGKPGLQGSVAARARRAIRQGLDWKSQERIDGQEGVKARELARLSPSVPTKGGYAQKWARVRSALENFIPEVKPGNQTALGTRADPFALFIARMHRKIHKFWGFGFLVDLDAKPDSNPMNNMSLWTMIEIVVAQNGSVEKATIVHASGLLTFDVAALDTVFSAGPYEATPRAIRSADGKVYLHWRFHRDQRQCGTFGVDPFILTTPPKGHVDNPAAEVGTGSPVGRNLRQLHRTPGNTRESYKAVAGGDDGHHHGESGGHDHSHSPAMTAKGKKAAAAAAAAARLDPNDPGALSAVRKFLAGFSAGSAQRMASACALPFRVSGKAVTKDRGDLARMFRDLLSEAGGRTASPPGRLLTVAQARGQLGALPEGVEVGDAVLLGLATLGRTPVTLLIAREKGGWQIIGLNR
jgi:hypothetical protein